MTPLSQQHPTVLLESFTEGQFSRSFRFDGLETVITALTPGEVVPALRQVEQAVESGLHAAGFVSYEAASALNLDLPSMEPGDLPLVWFGIFQERCEYLPHAETEGGDCHISSPGITIDKDAYGAAIKNIRGAIAAGETYQVNFTTRQRFRFSGNPFALYRRICRNQQAPFCAWIDTGDHRILSASPELFFSLKEGILTMRPMKGTAPRLPSPEADGRQRERLAADPKERAENLMIVDLVRNDLARVAETGTVEVPALFDVETYPTVHQMTSTVTARLRPGAGLLDILRALFPCGSVTGAPKRRTMEIIRDLEEGPRGVYCGAIGSLSPGNEALFSVAIRTVVLATAAETGELGIGSGITWDSDAESEYRECLTKAAFLHREPPDFRLIESLRHDEGGYLLLERHIDRMARSATDLGFGFDAPALRHRLAELGRSLSGAHKVRVLLAVDGSLELAADPIAGTFLPLPLGGEGGGGVPFDSAQGTMGETLGERSRTHSPPDIPLEGGGVQLVALASQRVDSADPLLYHKTTRRGLFDGERQRHPDCTDVIFLNERGEVTEGSHNNLVVSLRGELLTPALSCGLLPGVLRAELLEAGTIREAVLTVADLERAEKIWLINSVRGWRECRLKENDESYGNHGNYVNLSDLP